LNLSSENYVTFIRSKLSASNHRGVFAITAFNVVALLTSMPASAGLINWAFTGEVISISRSQPPVFENTDIGDPIIGVFSYGSTMTDVFADRDNVVSFNAPPNPVDSYSWKFAVGATSKSSSDADVQFGVLQIADNEKLDGPYTRDNFLYRSSTNLARLSITLIDPMLDPADGEPDAIDGLGDSPPREIALGKFGCNGGGYTRVDGLAGSCGSFATILDPSSGQEQGAVGFRITSLHRVPAPATLGLMAAGLLLLRRKMS
jgi:hypothetical protein